MDFKYNFLYRLFFFTLSNNVCNQYCLIDFFTDIFLQCGSPGNLFIPVLLQFFFFFLFSCSSKAKNVLFICDGRRTCHGLLGCCVVDYITNPSAGKWEQDWCQLMLTTHVGISTFPWSKRKVNQVQLYSLLWDLHMSNIYHKIFSCTLNRKTFLTPKQPWLLVCFRVLQQQGFFLFYWGRRMKTYAFVYF